MDFCRNMSVTGGLPSDYPPEQVVSPAAAAAYSKLGVSSCSVDDLFSAQNLQEGDVNLEWLSNFVEDCLSSTGNCINQPPLVPIISTPPNLIKKQHSSSSPSPSNHHHPKTKNTHKNNPPSLQKFLSIPAGKARTKRKRTNKPSPTTPLSTTTNKSWSSSHQQETKYDPQNQNHHVVISDTPLLVHQAYWLADSELINVPQKENNMIINSTVSTTTTTNTTTDDDEVEEEDVMMMMKQIGSCKDSLGSSTGIIGQPRRCTHCLSQRTPQWRAGPLGPKTLCNACGVRFKSGRLLPEYRPAKSPTFVSYKHSNSHKKVMEMRMSLLPYSSIHSE